MRLNRPQLITIVVTAIAAIALLAFILVDVMDEDPPANTAVQRPNSHVLDQGKSNKAVLVEFLDFECEACGSIYPAIESVRKKYKGDLTFVVRYFPNQSHKNSRNAAHAAEAAARQGKFEEMYSRLFTTQAEWGESTESQADLFRSYADELGLDMDKFDKDVKSKSVARRVQSDYEDAVSLDLRGTPSLFLNGEQFQPKNVEDIYAVIDKALAD